MENWNQLQDLILFIYSSCFGLCLSFVKGLVSVLAGAICTDPKLKILQQCRIAGY
jgi:hypothetical protein